MKKKYGDGRANERKKNIFMYMCNAITKRERGKKNAGRWRKEFAD